ncbi:hypothetical protein NKH18_32835 [Streptomyces sp. M10(2022)]
MASQSSSGSEMDVDHPSTADADHRAAVDKHLSEQKPSNLSLMGNYLTTRVRPAPIAGAPADSGRPKTLSQIGTESLNRLYTENPGPEEDHEWHWDRESWSKVRAEVESVHAYLSARTRLADGGDQREGRYEHRAEHLQEGIRPGRSRGEYPAPNAPVFTPDPCTSSATKNSNRYSCSPTAATGRPLRAQDSTERRIHPAPAPGAVRIGCPSGPRPTPEEMTRFLRRTCRDMT